MALGKNFRLPVEVKPARYNVHFAPDLKAGTFEGRVEIEVELAKPRREIILHAIDLKLRWARARIDGKTIRAEGKVDAESQTLSLAFVDELPAGKLTLELAWNGKFTPGLRGLYRAGNTVVTQFEAADARRVFPCFDEPAFKARWTISTMGVPKDAAAISNGKIVKDVPVGGSKTGERQVVFAETPPLSSYLIALCIGELKASEEVVASKIPIRTWSIPAKAHLTAFAQECAAAVLPLLEEYFGKPYAYGKLDQIGVPDFEAGAMENAGCITFREVALLLDPKTAPLGVQKRVAEVITHELAHQWFGNLVTMVWWDDLWLNEAFATWMAYKIVDVWKPKWRVWMDFEVGKGAALTLDALQSSHPIRAQIKNAEEAGEAFDAITYEKGGAILRMIEAWLGEDRFRDGIRAYMRYYFERNATASNLWGALAESSGGQPILELANGWIRQVGYPLVDVKEKDGWAQLRQSRFFSDPEAVEKGKATSWMVPMVLRFSDQMGVREVRVLLDAETKKVELGRPSGGPIAWILANVDAAGFYRVAYDEELLRRLIEALPTFSATERMSLISDQWALVRSGRGTLTAFIGLMNAQNKEEDHVVLDEVVSRLNWLEHRALIDDDRPMFHAFVARIFSSQGGDLGWFPKDGESDERKLRRAAVMRALALVARHPLTLEMIDDLFRAAMGTHAHQVDPNLLDVVMTAAARGADQARFDQLRARAQSEVDPAARRRFLLALAAVEKPELVQQAIDLALGDAVQMQDFASFVGVLLGNRATREQTFALIKSRWPEVKKKADSPMLLRRLVEALGSLPERRHLQEVEAFLAANKIEGATQAIAQTLERMRMDVALRERIGIELKQWLRGRAGL